MMDTRAHAPWFLWAYIYIGDGRRMVAWSLSDTPPIRESEWLRLAACAVVPSHMLP
jgi:hypothetical protein